MKRTSAFVIALATVLMATAARADYQQPRDDIQAPRGQDDKAPRYTSDEIQAPRGAEVQAPRQ